MEVTHRTLRCGEVDLHVAEAGPPDAPPLVLLHGWPHTWVSWRRVAERLHGDLRLVMPDLRGLGDSSVPASGYDKPTIAGDVAVLVRDVLALEDPVVVGHDWGGVVAFYTAWLLGEHACGLGVVDVTVPNDLGAGPDISQGGGRWHHAFHRTSLPEALVTGREEVYYRWFYETLGATPDAVPEESVLEHLRTYAEPAHTRAGFAYYRTGDEDRAAAGRVGRGGLRVPVLALGGDSSWGRGEEPLECLRFFADDVTGGAVADCGHFVPEERPDALADALRTFVARCREGGSRGPAAG